MEQSAIFTSINKNMYMYDNKSSLSMLVHPDFKRIFENGHTNNPYYDMKYKYLKSHGFFSTIDTTKYLITTIEESKIEDCIIQSPQVVFEVTNHCNLKCRYCALGDIYEWDTKRNNKNLDISSALTLLNYIYKLKLRNRIQKFVISFYGGEPLVNFTFINKVLNYIKKLNSRSEMEIGFNMTTNATLIDKHIDYLVKNQFKILISLDGNEINNSYRTYSKDGKNSFTKVVNNIDLIKEKYPDFFDKNISFNAVLHNRNSVKSIYEFIYKRYNKYPHVSQLNSSGVNPERIESYNKLFHSLKHSESEYSIEKYNLLPHNNLLIYQEVQSFIKNLSINYYLNRVGSLLYKTEKYYPANTCLPFSKKVFLTTNNTILPCERINYKYFIGEVNNEVMINPKDIIKKYGQYYDHLKKSCMNCYAYRFCGYCMFHIESFDKINSGEGICNFYFDKESFQKMLCRIYSFLENYPEDFSEIVENVLIS